MPTVDLPQGVLHYRVAGPEAATGPVAVLVHGLLVDGRLWSAVATQLAARGIRSVAPDLPLGSHNTPLRPESDLSPRGVAQLLNDLFAALELDQVTLVGNDTGGAICQFLLDTDAKRIGRLVLTNCDAFDKFPPPPFNALVALGRSERRIKPMLAPMRWTALRHSVLGFGGLVSHPLDAALTRSWLEPASRDAGIRRDTAKFLRGIRPADLLDVSTRLREFKKPVRLVWGAADPFFKLRYAYRLRDAFADASLTELPGARAFVPVDEPERLAEEIASLG